MNGIIGGVVAQEVMKSVSGKFHPIFQWTFFDAVECLPQNFEDDGSLKEKVDEKEFQGTGTRYDGQIAVFGKRFQDTLGDQKWFVVGAGAIGCEHLKNFAMMGLGARNGQLVVTDMDLIERSNLNRQFLFRPTDVGHPKSQCAANAVKEMNPSLNIDFQNNRMGKETEEFYNEKFFEQLSGVANALDNIEARTYMDKRCVLYKKPLLESGTLGTKGNTQVVIPYLTESYSSSRDPPETSIPMCTLKHYPNRIEHTIQWAKNIFEKVFTQNPQDANDFLQNPQQFMDRTLLLNGSEPLEKLESLKKSLIDDRPKDFEDCVIWARLLWEDSFNNSIRQLLFNFPPDYTTTSGLPFWSGSKRCPTNMTFSLEEPFCLDFVYTAANLRAEMYGIAREEDKEEVGQMAMAIDVPEFTPRVGVAIPVTDAEAQNECGDVDADRLKKLQETLPSAEPFQGLTITPLQFEKDDDSNFHIDFIVAASNCRATNYQIPPADRMQTKLIAGKIIPAIATTTSVVSGLIGLELIKIAQGMKKVDPFKNAFLNLALPFFGFSSPIVAEKMPDSPQWTLWDQFEVQGEMNLGDFIKYFKRVYNLEITSLCQGQCMLYGSYMSKENKEERMVMSLVELVEHVSKKPIEPYEKAIIFTILCNDRTGKDVGVPCVRYEIPLSQPQPEPELEE